MKATGVVRRIDELGRIVIPKEIRKNFRIKEGENIEIFISDDESIILKKHSTLSNLNQIAKNLTESITEITGQTIIITDMSEIVSISGPLKRNIENNDLVNNFFNLLEKRNTIIEYKKNKIDFISQELVASYIIKPLVLNGDLIGSILVVSEDSINNEDISLIDLASKILLKHIEQ